MKILVADDEEGIRKLVGRIVTDDGYEVCFASDGVEALRIFRRERPDLVVLDVMMPGLNGYEVCERLRETGAAAPIIFLSAKGDIIDQGTGFGVGGDDYIAKPFSPKELSLRIRARLQQHVRASRATAKEGIPSDFSFNEKRHQVCVRGEAVNLTPKEFQILALLARNPGEVFTREQIIEEAWGDEYVGETTSVAVFIRKIREKIEQDPSHPRYLQTVWHVGYKFGD